jgi:hypothetical protein
MELREKMSNIENKIGEVLENTDYSRTKEGYIMNRITGKPMYEED